MQRIIIGLATFGIFTGAALAQYAEIAIKTAGFAGEIAQSNEAAPSPSAVGRAVSAIEIAQKAAALATLDNE